MSTPAEQIKVIEAGLPDALADLDLLQRLHVLRDAAEAIEALKVAVSGPYREAIREHAADVGPTAVAREIGVSRGRINQIIKNADRPNDE